MISSPDLELFQVNNKVRIPIGALRAMLPTKEVALFFAKLYKMDASSLGLLLRQLFQSTVVEALTEGSHSTELQGYLVELGHQVHLNHGEVSYNNDPLPGEILPQLWEAAEVEIATSIQEVADKVGSALSMMQGKEGRMVFETMARMNMRRPTIGVHAAAILHKRSAANLVILDVSGSMTEHTIRTIVHDVVALGYKADAHLAIVSNSATLWGPGEYNADAILKASEFGGTYYEELLPLMNRDWGTVVTIADYDSSLSAKEALAGGWGSIDTVLDISLVNRPTFLAECVGQRARTVKPLMIGNSYRPLS